jgi:hypothetical protein
MHFYMHSNLHKNFILAKSGCYTPPHWDAEDFGFDAPWSEGDDNGGEDDTDDDDGDGANSSSSSGEGGDDDLPPIKRYRRSGALD